MTDTVGEFDWGWRFINSRDMSISCKNSSGLVFVWQFPLPTASGPDDGRERRTVSVSDGRSGCEAGISRTGLTCEETRVVCGVHRGRRRKNRRRGGGRLDAACAGAELRRSTAAGGAGRLLAPAANRETADAADRKCVTHSHRTAGRFEENESDRRRRRRRIPKSFGQAPIRGTGARAIKRATGRASLSSATYRDQKPESRKQREREKRGRRLM